MHLTAAAAAAGLPALVAVACAFAVPTGASFARFWLSIAQDPKSTVAPHIPRGSCVVFDSAGNLIDSDRFFSSRARCPSLVDAFGLWLTDNDGNAPPAPEPYDDAFVAKWRAWLGQAEYTVLWRTHSTYIPWTRSLTSWFNSNYRLVASGRNAYVYKHITS
jgi:hypothetical protein